MKAYCDKCTKEIRPGQGHYRIEGEDGHWCSDTCLETALDEDPGPGKWRRDKTPNEAGGYLSVFCDGGLEPINLYWTEMEEDGEEDGERDEDAICCDRCLRLLPEYTARFYDAVNGRALCADCAADAGEGPPEGGA